MRKSFLSRKDRIILSAIDIISESGFQGLSTKVLAAKQEMAESLLYKYFKGIDEVIVAVVNYFALYDSSIINTIKKKETGSKEKVYDFIKAYAEYYENYPAITAVMQNYETLSHEVQTQKLIKDILDQRFLFLTYLIEEGQAKGELNRHYLPEELAELIIGLLHIVILRWRLSGCSFPLKQKLMATVEKVLVNC